MRVFLLYNWGREIVKKEGVMKTFYTLTTIALLSFSGSTLAVEANSVPSQQNNFSAANQVQLHQKFAKAIKKGNTDAVKQMTAENPSIISSIDPNGYTPLHNAAFYGRKQIVEHLIENGADINVTDSKNGFTPLHSAATKKCNVGVVQALLAKNADQTLKDKYGKTALEYATQCKKKIKYKNNN